MGKNKSLFLLVLVFGVVFVSGCIEPKQPNDKPYITNVNPDKSFGIEGDTINVAVTVTNPTKVNYNGYVLIQAESPSCFGMGDVNIGTEQKVQNVKGYLAPISVLAVTSNGVLMTMHIPLSNPPTCYQPASHKLSVYLILLFHLCNLSV